MRTFGAFALLTGIGVGLFLYRPGPIGHDALREDVQRRDNESNQSCAASALSGRDRSFAPQLSLANLQATKKEHAKTPPSSIDHARQSTIAARALTPETRMTVTGWQPIVTNTAGMIKSGSAAATLRPKDATSRYKLVVKLQRNLKKRGCYWGRIDGSWGTGSKYAMQAFIDRINAALPIDEPDYLLLTMLQANTDKMCGGCPVGQTTTFGGSCIPEAMAANAQTKPGSGRRSIAEVLPWQRAGAPQPTGEPLLRPVGKTIITTAPLPGHMAIGGQKQLPPPWFENDSVRSNVAAAIIEDPERSRVSRPAITRTPKARPKRRAVRKTQRPRRRARQRNAVRRNLMLGLGGLY
jgi:hypothetical protein